MIKKEIKIITLGDIFKNIETEEKAFKFLNYIKELQQENQQLKKLCNKYEEEHNKTFKEWKEAIKRIDKAIEYMDRRDLEWLSDEHNKMMSILKGEEKDE